MSFHWNLSSDDDDDDENIDAVETDIDSGNAARNEHRPLVTLLPQNRCGESWNLRPAGSKETNLLDSNLIRDWNLPHRNEDYEDDNDDVEWEDADHSDDAEDEDRKPAAIESTGTHQASLKLQPITIDLDRPTNKSTDENGGVTSRKRKRRNVFRVESLPHNMQSMLRDLHNTHLLSLTGHVIHLSNLCSDPEITSLAYSLIPDRWDTVQQQAHKQSSTIKKYHPTLPQMQQFVKEWYIPLVHETEERRREQQSNNRRAGAPMIRRARRGQRGRVHHKVEAHKSNAHDVDGDTRDRRDLLRMLTLYLSKTADEDPQLAVGSEIPSLLRNPQTSDQLHAGLLIAMVRSLGWRARLVSAIEPISIDLTVNHPILTSFCRNIFKAVTLPTKKKSKNGQRQSECIQARNGAEDWVDQSVGMFWVEILCVDHQSTKNPYRWYHVDPTRKLINRPDTVEGLLGQRLQQQQRHVLAYAVSVEHSSTCSSDISPPRLRLTDVTPRYVQSWIASLRKRGLIRSKNCSIKELIRDSWWTKTLHAINAVHRSLNSVKASNGSSQHPIVLDESDNIDETLNRLDDHENDELIKAANNEAMPTSKAEFKTHPIYVIPSELGKTEALHPDAKQRVCGVFKGQLVYRRSDVSTLYTAKKWLYSGRKVRDNELTNPIKTPTKRKKPPVKGFKALRSYGVGATNDGSEKRQIEQGSIPLDDDTDKLYGIWQTDAWSPDYIGPNDDIPTNEFKNIELALLNPGLVHIDQTGLAGVAKKLGIPYAPCLLGFEGHGGNRTPTVRGIVVHEHNEQLIREAGVEVQNFQVEKECNDRRRYLLLQWKRLMVGLLTKDRLDREYGGEDE